MELREGQTLVDIVGLPAIVRNRQHSMSSRYCRIVGLQTSMPSHPLVGKFHHSAGTIYGLALEDIEIVTERVYILHVLMSSLPDAHPQVWLNTYADLLRRSYPYDLKETEEMKWAFDNLCKEYLYTYQFPEGPKL